MQIRRFILRSIRPIFRICPLQNKGTGSPALFVCSESDTSLKNYITVFAIIQRFVTNNSQNSIFHRFIPCSIPNSSRMRNRRLQRREIYSFLPSKMAARSLHMIAYERAFPICGHFPLWFSNVQPCIAGLESFVSMSKIRLSHSGHINYMENFAP